MGKPDLIQEIIEIDSRVHRVVRQRSFDAWMDLNLTVPQVKTLFFISNQRGSTSGKLAARLGVTPSNVTGIVERLTEHGLLKRHELAEDRRIMALETTEKAELILSDLRERRASTMREILKHLNKEELEGLAKSMTSLDRAAGVYREEHRDEYDRS